MEKVFRRMKVLNCFEGTSDNVLENLTLLNFVTFLNLVLIKRNLGEIKDFETDNVETAELGEN